MPRSWIVTVALLVNILICGIWTWAMGRDLLFSRAIYPPIELGPVTLPAAFRHAVLLWPGAAVLLSLAGLFANRTIRFLGMIVSATFQLFMGALFISLYISSLEHDPNRTGGILPQALLWLGAVSLNVTAWLAERKDKTGPGTTGKKAG